ncbi:MAG: cobalt-precorrin-5B (C(1))-methyltransferase, partial [Acidimicrobiales bacterium]
MSPDELADGGALDDGRPVGPLRRGWSTGACATAATQAAFEALVTGSFPDPVAIELPRGECPVFALALAECGSGFARAGVVKDAGDDPDVTHGLTIVSTVRPLPPGSGVRFRAGPGVGTVTLPGLPLPPGEPAINPVPRRLMREAVSSVALRTGTSADAEVELSVPGGEQVALRTWNPRLGIVGGLSILGTTGVVIPYSCSAWIHSIHRGVDVARAVGHRHVAGCTGTTSERAVQERFGLPDTAMLDMGDFAGGMLRYVRRHPLPRLTIGGGFAKLSKLAAGHEDLHSGRSQVDLAWLAEQAAMLGAD